MGSALTIADNSRIYLEYPKLFFGNGRLTSHARCSACNDGWLVSSPLIERFWPVDLFVALNLPLTWLG